MADDDVSSSSPRSRPHAPKADQPAPGDGGQVPGDENPAPPGPSTPTLGRRGRRVLPPQDPTPPGAEPAAHEPDEASPAETEDPPAQSADPDPAAAPTPAATPQESEAAANAPVGGEGEIAVSTTSASPGALGRWRQKLQDRSARPAVQPAQTPARDVEISTSELADPDPTAETAVLPAITRPKATPLKRRSAPVEGAPAGITSPGAGDPRALTPQDGPPQDGSPQVGAPQAEAPRAEAPEATPDESVAASSAALAGDESPGVAPVTGSATPAPVDAAPLTAGSEGVKPPPSAWSEPHRRTAMDKKTKTSLLIAGIAGAVLTVLAIGFAVWSVTTNEVAAPSAGPSLSASTAPKPTALSDDFLLSDSDASLIDPAAGWKVSLTQDSTNADSPQPICIRQASEGLPTPLSTKLRTLTTANANQTAALHQADGYATADEAQQIFDDRLTQLGTCAESPAIYLSSGVDVLGVGDQAGGVVAVLQGEKPIYHSVVLTRTGKVVNVIDVAQATKPVNLAGLGKAAAAVVDDECSAAVGLCSFNPVARAGVPPLGGDQPGFLAGADLPRISDATGDWSGTNPVTDITVVGSQCESTDFANVDGPTNRKARTYLLRNDDAAPANFGIDEVRFTMATPADASKLVDKISDSVGKCPDRALTAKVQELPKIRGVGADKVAVTGRSFLVTQKTESGDVLFRIAMVSAGNKFAYLVMPTDAKFDFTDQEWTTIALRAGQRMSQVR